jgi:hypothetical protein
MNAGAIRGGVGNGSDKSVGGSGIGSGGSKVSSVGSPGEVGELAGAWL